MTNETINNLVNEILIESIKINNYYNSDEKLADAINNVSRENLEKCWAYYIAKSGIIVDIRKDLLQYLLDGNKVTKDTLHAIVDKHKLGKERQFQVYNKLYSIFYPILTIFGHSKIRKNIEIFISQLISDLKLKDYCKSIYYDFQGARQLGSDRLWLAIYNKSQPNQSKSLQFFVEFYNGNIRYGIYTHQTKSYISEAYQKNQQTFEYNKLLVEMEKETHHIINDNLVETVLKESIVDYYEESGSHSLNQILFGPPGTGKTYQTINRAVSIANPDFNLEQDRSVIKDEYQRLVDSGQIVFTTFHQSMSYEDFVEGIKPIVEEDEDGNKQVIYEIKDGIFKEVVQNAKLVQDSENRESHYTFDDAWNDLIQTTNFKIENNEKLFLPIQTKNLGLNVVGISAKGNLVLKPAYSQNSKEYIVSYSRAKKLQEVYFDLSIIKNIDKEFRSIIGGSNSTAYWAALNFINEKIIDNDTSSQKVEEQNRNYILIIDEINRGNVSAIFGELITLIEESKRSGNVEALELTLPYSKEKFSVPKNLYIIGTMNTADRSVEALDTALRRRFVFEEMLPNPDLKELNYSIFEHNASDILKRINLRIEKLIDKDHCIGHAYFIDKDEESIIDSFYMNIIPLLQEYFFGDYGKIGLVLGQGFIENIKDNGDIFASFDYDYRDDLSSRSIFRIIDHRKTSDKEKNFKAALDVLMK